MRVPLLTILLIAGAVSAHAQSLNPEPFESFAVGQPKGGKLRPVVARDTATSTGHSMKLYRRLDVTGSTPDRDDIEFAHQLLSEPFRMPNVQLETVNWNELKG